MEFIRNVRLKILMLLINFIVFLLFVEQIFLLTPLMQKKNNPKHTCVFPVTGRTLFKTPDPNILTASMREEKRKKYF